MVHKAKEKEKRKDQQDGAIFDLVKLLCSVDIDSADAILNETTITDGQGGRILL